MQQHSYEQEISTKESLISKNSNEEQQLDIQSNFFYLPQKSSNKYDLTKSNIYELLGISKANTFSSAIIPLTAGALAEFGELTVEELFNIQFKWQYHVIEKLINFGIVGLQLFFIINLWRENHLNLKLIQEVQQFLNKNGNVYRKFEEHQLQAKEKMNDIEQKLKKIGQNQIDEDTLREKLKDIIQLLRYAKNDIRHAINFIIVLQDFMKEKEKWSFRKGCASIFIGIVAIGGGIVFGILTANWFPLITSILSVGSIYFGAKAISIYQQLKEVSNSLEQQKNALQKLENDLKLLIQELNQIVEDNSENLFEVAENIKVKFLKIFNQFEINDQIRNST